MANGGSVKVDVQEILKDAAANVETYAVRVTPVENPEDRRHRHQMERWAFIAAIAVVGSLLGTGIVVPQPPSSR